MIGPKMMEAVAYVKAHPGAATHEVSRAVGPNGSLAYGWQIVRRCERAGLIERIDEGNKKACYVTPEGAEL